MKIAVQQPKEVTKRMAGATWVTKVRCVVKGRETEWAMQNETLTCSPN